MSLVNLLLDNSAADRDLMRQNDSLGDQFDIPQDVEFVLLAGEIDKANLVRDFINDNGYGQASVQPDGDGYRILVRVHMAPQEHVLCSVSGLIVCLCRLFDIEYDGWGCLIKKGA